MLQYAAADIISSYLETFLFGIYSVLFIICIWQLLKARNPNRILLFVAITEFMLSLSYIILDLRRVATSFTPNPVLPIIMVYEAHHLDRLEKAANWLYVVGAWLADAVLVWRCWVVWDRKIKYIIPSLVLYVVIVVCAIGATITSFDVSPLGVMSRSGQNWGDISVGCSIALNVLNTSLIAGKLWSHKRKIDQAFGRHADTNYYTWLIAIVVETGFVYTACLIAEFALFTTTNPGVMIIVAISGQVVGIVPTCIIILTSLGRSAADKMRTSNQSLPTTSAVSGEFSHRHMVQRHYSPTGAVPPTFSIGHLGNTLDDAHTTSMSNLDSVMEIVNKDNSGADEETLDSSAIKIPGMDLRTPSRASSDVTRISVRNQDSEKLDNNDV